MIMWLFILFVAMAIAMTLAESLKMELMVDGMACSTDNSGYGDSNLYGTETEKDVFQHNRSYFGYEKDLLWMSLRTGQCTDQAQGDFLMSVDGATSRLQPWGDQCQTAVRHTLLGNNCINIANNINQ